MRAELGNADSDCLSSGLACYLVLWAVRGRRAPIWGSTGPRMAQSSHWTPGPLKPTSRASCAQCPGSVPHLLGPFAWNALGDSVKGAFSGCQGHEPNELQSKAEFSDFAAAWPSAPRPSASRARQGQPHDLWPVRRSFR